ncbi:alginate export family protein [Rheinheimera sp.]|uniref:alginate export family protein n=1 Tax=Rheinheimera sp. TaxID=1869214 RepID=UPI00307FC38D
MTKLYPISCCLLLAVPPLQAALPDPTVNYQFRYRLETVEQQGLEKDAAANTLLSRLSLAQPLAEGWSAQAEVDYVAALDHSGYHDSVNGKSRYPVIADPDGADLNQLFLQFQQQGHRLKVGRQRINLGNERFVGGSAWRQNEQTFDALRYQWQQSAELSLDYSYISKVNRVFGNKHPQGDWSARVHLLRADYHPLPNHKLGLMWLQLDIADAAAQSSQTAVLDYSVSQSLSARSKHQFSASYARQQDSTDNPANYSADYYALDWTLWYSQWLLAVGVEQLGTDNSVPFSTPLATLHKFQGFADKFLSTPALGVQDRYLKLGYQWHLFDLQSHYHQYKAAAGDQDYGTELNLQLSYSLSKEHQLLLKYADYQAKQLFTDTRKFWLQWLARF